MKSLLVGLLLLAQGATQSGTGGGPTLTLRGLVIDETYTPNRGAGRGGTSFHEVRLIHDGVVSASVPSPSGTFQFRNLSPGRYFITVEPNFADLPPFAVDLVDRNIEDLIIRIPKASLKTTTLRGTFKIEGGGVLPSIRLILTSTVRGGGVRTYSVSEPAFSFQETPIGEYSIEIQNLPAGYSVRSITAGTTDLLVQKLRLTAASPGIAITLAVSPPPR